MRADRGAAEDVGKTIFEIRVIGKVLPQQRKFVHPVEIKYEFTEELRDAAEKN